MLESLPVVNLSLMPETYSIVEAWLVTNYEILYPVRTAVEVMVPAASDYPVGRLLKSFRPCRNPSAPFKSAAKSFRPAAGRDRARSRAFCRADELQQVEFARSMLLITVAAHISIDTPQAAVGSQLFPPKTRPPASQYGASRQEPVEW